jgi:DNA-binding NarL/FixJ family response regulator
MRPRSGRPDEYLLRPISSPSHSAVGRSRGGPVLHLLSTAQRERETFAVPVRVVVADQHPFARQGLIKLLTDSSIDVVGEVANCVALVEVVELTAPDVVVIDGDMTGGCPVQVIRELTGGTPPCRVLVLSTSVEAADVSAAILAGASGYLRKDRPVDEVVMGIRAAAAGGSLISPSITPTPFSPMPEPERVRPDPPPSPRVALSRRELDVLRLIADGKGNREIGEALFIEAGTVRNHVSRVLKKLDVDNRVQAAVRAVRDQLV